MNLELAEDGPWEDAKKDPKTVISQSVWGLFVKDVRQALGLNLQRSFCQDLQHPRS